MRSILVLTVSVVAGFQAHQVSNSSTDRDRAVYRAVLAHTIQPAINRMSSDAGVPTPALIVTSDHTVAICRPSTDRAVEVGCMNDQRILQEFERESIQQRPQRPPLFDGLLSRKRREELATEFRTRNMMTAPFSGATLQGLIVVPPETLTETVRRESARTKGFARFSTPAFSSDGYALVYGSIGCDGQCGTGWFFLLREAAESWVVVKVELLWIS